MRMSKEAGSHKGIARIVFLGRMMWLSNISESFAVDAGPRKKELGTYDR